MYKKLIYSLLTVIVAITVIANFQIVVARGKLSFPEHAVLRQFGITKYSYYIYITDNTYTFDINFYVKILRKNYAITNKFDKYDCMNQLMVIRLGEKLDSFDEMIIFEYAILELEE